jgi:hypothetical protein
MKVRVYVMGTGMYEWGDGMVIEGAVGRGGIVLTTI